MMLYNTAVRHHTKRIFKHQMENKLNKAHTKTLLVGNELNESNRLLQFFESFPSHGRHTILAAHFHKNTFTIYNSTCSTESHAIK